MIYKEIDNKAIQSFEYETTIISDSKIVGTCELGKANIQLLNDSNKYSVFKDSWIKTIQGSFYIYNVQPVQEKVSIKLECYDIKYKLDTPYESTKYSFPCTLKTWRNSIFDSCDVKYDDADFPNSDLVLEKEPYIETGSSNRAIIKMIAEAGASVVITDNNDKFYFSWFENITHNVDDWIELTTEKESSIPINCVILGRGNTEDNVYYPKVKPTNPIEFRIDNNYILDPQDISSSEDLRYTTIVPIYNRVNNFSYLIFKMKSQTIKSKLSIKLGQKIKFKDIWSNELEAYVMTKKINWLGGDLENDDNYEIILSASKISETSTNLSYASNIKDDVLRVERKTDKNAAEISDLVQKVVNLSATVTGINKLELTGCSNTPLYKLIITCDDDLLFPNTKLFPSSTTYLKNSLLYINRGTDDEITYDLGISSLRALGTVKDEFILEDGRATLIKRIGLNSNLEKYVLDEPVTKDLGYLSVSLKEGNNTIELPSFSTSRLTATYLLKNQYTDTFATQASVTNKIKVAQDEILIESKSQILESGDELIASINTTSTGNVKIKASDTISLEGAVSANGNFKIDEKGNAIMTSAQITGGDITLPEGGKVVGGDGMMSVMIVNASIWSSQFLGGQGFMPMGFEGISSQGYAISQMLDFVIPENFKPRKAFIYLKHIPLTSKGYFDTQTEQSYTGYARNVKAYLCDDGSSSRSINYSIGPPTIGGNYTEIPKAFGVNGFTGSATELKEKTSIDISNYIKNPGTYSIQLKSSMAAPTAYKTIYEATGCLLAQLYIYGYTSEQIE